MSVTEATRGAGGDQRRFLLALLLNALWINASEVFRYLVLVMPMTRSALPQFEQVAPMNGPVFAIWAAWDTLLLVVATGFQWLYLERFGDRLRTAVAAGTWTWAGIFVIFWVAVVNMNLVPREVPAVALPLAWLEMVVSALIVRAVMRR